MVVLLIVAGHETTVSLIGNAVLALLQHPDQRQALESDPTRMSHAIEELLRYDGPSNGRSTAGPPRTSSWAAGRFAEEKE